MVSEALSVSQTGRNVSAIRKHVAGEYKAELKKGWETRVKSALSALIEADRVTRAGAFYKLTDPPAKRMQPRRNPATGSKAGAAAPSTTPAKRAAPAKKAGVAKKRAAAKKPTERAPAKKAKGKKAA